MECLPDIIETRLLTPDTPYDCILTLLSGIINYKVNSWSLLLPCNRITPTIKIKIQILPGFILKNLSLYSQYYQFSIVNPKFMSSCTG